ncbi:hypothetical protein NA56DRAFT_663614 [Hyaloscypha hepaticicola]|uniref:Uncharacterized protein n=1 Tax=Hyaloscypha hepaticicola TaxID=2082293 RepID=A0A2J6PPC3_9HELO|nr:hypothetical protein NA56DRAFT_663614 [Hyaloscypha hepaticicola]
MARPWADIYFPPLLPPSAPRVRRKAEWVHRDAWGKSGRAECEKRSLTSPWALLGAWPTDVWVSVLLQSDRRFNLGDDENGLPVNEGRNEAGVRRACSVGNGSRSKALGIPHLSKSPRLQTPQSARGAKAGCRALAEVHSRKRTRGLVGCEPLG